MIPITTFAGRKVALFGLGGSGLAAARALLAGGAEVVAFDDTEASASKAKEAGVTVADLRHIDWSGIAALVLAPGVPLTHPAPHWVVGLARNAAVPVIGDIELFCRERRKVAPQAPFIAITGTNGKSTTTALIGHILSASGFNAEVGGNIGKSVLELNPPTPKTIYVLEISSYQVDLSPGLVPDVGVLSNITPDHIDRHGTLENYAAVKARMVKGTAKNGTAVIGVDDEHTAAIYTRMASNGGAPAVPVSVGKVLGRGVFVVDGVLYDAIAGRATKVMDLTDAAHLPGAHNWQNAALAYAATKPYAKDMRTVASAIANFPGLAHRIEDVGRIGKVRFVNDSKATNADAAERALVCFPDIYWIAGGKAKEGGIEPLAPHFGRIRKAYLIGDAAETFAKTLDGKAPYEIARTLDVAVANATADAAQSGHASPVVLLSPACASFDQFSDFEARGDAFRDLVARISAQLVKEAS
ncbi:MAG TPA: UDP-N-acetylmuramoyl-L-alanine--D-glutamate ligase [Rhizomicrobium sp.]|nr:UDP-N-acetylmuramoyl-L-alanine--D-glutamate ligase [Rhizomicrobium sp.]